MNKGRPASTPQEVEDYKNQVCSTALRLVSEKGLEGFSFRRLATELDSSHTRVHRYFQDKEAIMIAVKDYAYGKFSEALESATKVPGDPLQTIEHCGDAYFQFAHSNPHAFQILFSNSETNRGMQSHNEGRAWNTLITPVTEAVDAGLFEGNPEVIARGFWSLIHGITCLSLSGSIQSEAEIKEALQTARTALQRGLFPATDKKAGSKVHG